MKTPTIKTSTIERLLIRDISVGARMRAVEPSRVQSLAESMTALGLMTPISVCKIEKAIRDGKEVSGVLALIAGAHRLAAAKQLGWEEIDCFLLDADDANVELWEIDENLCRAELTPAEVAQHTARRKKVWQKIRAEVSGTSCPTLPPTGRGNKGFAADSAAKTGQSKRTINRAVARGERLAPDVLDAVRGTKLDNGTALDKLATMPVEEQRRAVGDEEAQDKFLKTLWEKANPGLTRSSESVPADGAERRPTAKDARNIGSDVGLAARAEVCGEFLRNLTADTPRQVAALRAAWAKASAAARHEFLTEVGYSPAGATTESPDDDDEPMEGIVPVLVDYGDTPTVKALDRFITPRQVG